MQAYRSRHGLYASLLVVGTAWPEARANEKPPDTAAARPNCLGAYAEELSEMSIQARDLENSAPSYSFAVRTSATYECVSYGSDSKLKRTTTATRAHGTGFGFRHDGSDTLLITNEHVADWPDVTDDDHQVDGIPSGCRRLSDRLAIVDDDRDDYTADDIPLVRVVVDPALDVAILRARAKLPILPWKVGKSATLASRDAVEVRGFPLGKFRATNTGKVVSAYDHDDQGVRNHDDFVIDALLAPGGSGSPVLAVSCATHELELVGIFHSRYAGASALNVVIAIDQVGDLMTTLKRTTLAQAPATDLDGKARARIADAATRGTNPSFFALGSLVAKVHARVDGALVFAVFASDFPKTTAPLLVFEDLPSADLKRFGQLGRIFVAGATGLQPAPKVASSTDTLTSASHALDLLRRDALAALDHRDVRRTVVETRDAYELAGKKDKAFARMLESQRGAAQEMVDLAAKLRPTVGAAGLDKPVAGDVGLGLLEIEALSAVKGAPKP